MQLQIVAAARIYGARLYAQHQPQHQPQQHSISTRLGVLPLRPFQSGRCGWSLAALRFARGSVALCLFILRIGDFISPRLLTLVYPRFLHPTSCKAAIQAS